jgi:catalase
MAKSSRRVNGRSPSSGSATIHDQNLHRGTGGELHQIAEGDAPVLTTAQGAPVSDDQNSLRIGPRGPTLIEDFHFREKIFHFDHERIPERVVHARGYGAHGFFENYKPLSKYTRADLFQRAGERTPAFVRFSTVAGSKGSADLARDVRGFAVKLYTQEGNWDIVGNNIPVFFIQDAIKFPDIIHAVKEEPDCAFPQAQSAHDNFWDFISLTPESMHMIMWVMSDRAIPRSFRFMEGFGVHTFRLVNAKNESTFVKFHWKPKLGLQSVLWNEAVKINGADPDFHRRDLWTAIQTGNFPEWELQFQLFDQAFADSFEFDVLDPTKLIPVGHVNYQPNSFGEGPRESPARGFTPFPDVEQGAKRRLRAESFADHYSQARQFFISQTRGEQHHIAAALTFELSKVKAPVIRERMVSHLLNIDETLASKVGEALGLKAMPRPADAAMPTRQDLEPAPTLSIVENGPQRFEGRKLGILVTDGTDAAILKALKTALAKQGATFEIIAPKVGGAKASDGSLIEADQMIDGGPSVLYDGIALLPAEVAIDDLVQESTARDFVADAFAHCKFIGYGEAAGPLFAKAGIAEGDYDEGVIQLTSSRDVARFIGELGKLRVWGREPNVKMK